MARSTAYLTANCQPFGIGSARREQREAAEVLDVTRSLTSSNRRGTIETLHAELLAALQLAQQHRAAGPSRT